MLACPNLGHIVWGWHSPGTIHSKACLPWRAFFVITFRFLQTIGVLVSSWKGIPSGWKQAQPHMLQREENRLAYYDFNLCKLRLQWQVSRQENNTEHSIKKHTNCQVAADVSAHCNTHVDNNTSNSISYWLPQTKVYNTDSLFIMMEFSFWHCSNWILRSDKFY